MDRMASMELAIKNERVEMAFYKNEARRSKNPLAKQIFEMLAKDEEEHERRIKGLYDKLVGGGQWPADVPIEVAGTNVKSFFKGFLRRAGTDESHDDDDVAALKKAIEFEARGHDFYNQLAGACANPMEKRFFGFLSDIEHEHHASLVDALAYLENPEDYMARMGRAGLDGA